MSSDGDFKSMQDNITSCLVDVTRSAGQVASQDLNFLRATDPAATKLLDRQNDRLLDLTRRLCRSAAQGTGVSPPGLADLDAVDDNWKSVVDLVDILLEKADVCLDEYTGVIKKQTATQEGVTEASDARSTPSRPAAKATMPKPQRLFRHVPSNDETGAFKPLLRSKPHALVPLEESIAPKISKDQLEEYDFSFYWNIKESASLRSIVDKNLRFRHPYQREIELYQYPPHALSKADPIPPQKFENTTATYVDTLEGVLEMLEELKGAREIAVDLEHHDTHSYIGLVSLMQISMRDKDWIVDTLKPWREDLQILNEVFADPRILKVFHGSHSDMVWLQRDLGLYVVGLFDTFFACGQLRYPKKSLASLLLKFVDFTAQKQFQMADWRTRPLTTELFEYARSDTHFLLYIYDRMRNELIEGSVPGAEDGDLMAAVLRQSKEVSLQRFERPFYDMERGMGQSGWYRELIRTPSLFNREQFAVFRAVHQWRDRVARMEDEGLLHVMSKQALFNVAREMPTETSKLIGVLGKVPALVRTRISELAALIKRAKASGANGPEMQQFIMEHPATIENEQRRAAHRQEAAEAKQSVSRVLQREKAAVGGDVLQAETSQFWGSTFVNGRFEGRKGGATPSKHPEYRLHIPLPALTAEVFSSTSEPVAAPPAVHAAPAEHAYQKSTFPAPAPSPKPAEEVIVLRETKKSRKRKAQHDSSSSVVTSAAAEARSSPTNGTTNSQSNQAAQANDEDKEAVRAAKRARKRARRAERKAASNRNNPPVGPVDGGDEPAAAFDYAAAQSVLNAAPQAPSHLNEGGKNAKHKGSSGRGFDPYAMALQNAPKGPKGGKQDGVGRSATFRG